MRLSGKISEKDGNGFARAIRLFGAEAFSVAGRGAVVILEGHMIRHKDSRTEAQLSYMPTTDSDERMPTDVLQMVEAYDPECETVFAIVSGDGKATVVILREEA